MKDNNEDNRSDSDNNGSQREDSRNNDRRDGRDRRDGGGYQGNRDRKDSGGYQGNRDRKDGGGYQGNRDRKDGGGYQGNRDRKDSGGYQGNRDRRDGGGYQGNRDRRDGGGYQGNRDRRDGGGYQGNRDRRDGGGYQGNRDRGDGGGYQGNRDRKDSGGYQGNRDRGDGGYQGNRDRRDGGGYQGNRDRGDGGYQGNRDRRDGGGYQGNRDRRDGGGYQGNRDRKDSGGYLGNRDRKDSGGYHGNRDSYRGRDQRDQSSEARYNARRAEDDEIKQSERVDEEGYRAGVSAAGMFVKPKYNKKFTANQNKLTNTDTMPDAGRSEVLESLREDRLEGRNPVKEAIEAGRTIDKLWVLKPSDGRLDKAVIEIVNAVKAQGAVVMEVERAALDRISLTQAHQGVIAQTAVHEYVEVDEILAAAKAKGEDPLIIILDEIKDAYNLGSVFRIADAAGAHGVIIPKRRSVGLDAVVAKASAGSIEHVPCAKVTNLVNTVEDLKKAGLWIAGTAMEGSSELSKSDLTGPLAVVIGSEGEGMRDLVKQHCDLLLSIPMKGKVNSLNAAVAAGVVIFEIARQRDAKVKATEAE